MQYEQRRLKLFPVFSASPSSSHSVTSKMLILACDPYQQEVISDKVVAEQLGSKWTVTLTTFSDKTFT